VIDLMAALKASVDEKPRSAGKEGKSKAKSAPKSSTSRKRA